jgi:hypothetical protein
MAGQIRAVCNSRLPPPHVPGERRCAKCETVKHRVYLSFMHREAWHCSFLESDAKTVLPRKLALEDPKKLFEMAERGGRKMNLEAQQAIQHGIEIGRNGFWLELTEEQYQKLRIASRRR